MHPPHEHELEAAASTDPTSAAQLVNHLEGGLCLSRRLAAERHFHVEQLREHAEKTEGASWRDPDGLAWRELRAEVAAALQIHERTAQTQLDLSRQLVNDFIRTLEALWSGEASESHARALVDESAGLDETLREEYETLVLAAIDLPLGRFIRYARQVHASLAPEAMIERHREALAERRVAVEAAPDGMAWFGAYLSAEDAIGASAAVTGLARALKVDGETRTLAQIEADVFRDLVVDAAGVTAPDSAGEPVRATPAAQRGIRAEVIVHVPVLTAMGTRDDAGQLDGYGPIDADTARVLCAGAPGFIRVLTDPEDGAVRSFGRSAYRVPAELRRLLHMRDEVCRFVGCTRAAKLCDIDHSIPWQEDGETVEDNLAHLCRGHHRLKERGRWRLGHDPGGTIRWTSPTGKTYETKPARRVMRRIGATPRVMTEWDPPPF